MTDDFRSQEAFWKWIAVLLACISLLTEVLELIQGTLELLQISG